MFWSALAVVLSGAPLLPKLSLFRPRYGSFPLLLMTLCLLWIVLMRYALPGFRRRHTVAALGLCALLVLSWLPRSAGRGWGARFLTPAFHQYVIIPTTAVQIGVLGGLLLAPFWVPLGRLVQRRLRRQPDDVVAPQPTETAPAPAELVDEKAPLITRRALLTATPWLLPGGAFALASYGSFVEARRIVLRRVRVPVIGLPPSLHGFRIGQVTDLHIARDLTQLHHLERGLLLLAGERLDILCATGDLCDEPRLFLTVLRLLAQVPVRYGHFGCIGNHELFLGLDVVRRAYDRAPVQLLEDESVRLGGLRLAGIGYAMRGRSPRLSLPDVPLQLDEALRERGEGEPTSTVLLAHHPHVIGKTAGRNIALTISGHTHGGQLGFRDGSAIERFYPYARGHYLLPDVLAREADAPQATGNPSQLFVSSGLGHWLPVRLNCPPEVVVIELFPARARGAEGPMFQTPSEELKK
jgi:predicted MPP superfamily phosphohydrolase